MDPGARFIDLVVCFGQITSASSSNPRKTRAIAEAKAKTDKVDARILAQLLAADFLPSSWVMGRADCWMLVSGLLPTAVTLLERLRLGGQSVEQPVRPDYLCTVALNPCSKLSVGRYEHYRRATLCSQGDQGVISVSGSMDYLDTIDVALLDAGLGFSFEHQHDTGIQRPSSDSLSEPRCQVLGCAGPVAPPTVGAGADYVGGVDEQHDRSFAYQRHEFAVARSLRRWLCRVVVRCRALTAVTVAAAAVHSEDAERLAPDCPLGEWCALGLESDWRPNKEASQMPDIATGSTPPMVDLSWGRSFVDGFPHDFFTWLRREQPVWWHEPTEHTPDGIGFWVVSRHEDTSLIMRDPATFSSGLGGTEIADSPAAGAMLNMADDPEHRRLRSLVSKGFTPRMIGRLEADLRARARRILSTVPVGTSFEFVNTVAQELPLQAICGLLGIPLQDRAELLKNLDEGLEAETGEIIGSEQLRELTRYGMDLIRQKRECPADDILSVIVHSGVDDDTEPLTDRELRNFFALLFPAGAETTRSAISGAVLAFIEYPDQLARLRAEPELMPTALEEIVRWTTPSVYKRRTATREVIIGGQTIHKDDKVTFWEMSANRDEQVFSDPFSFDIGRDPNPHLGFGLGVHFCLGAHLARLELRVMIEELLARYDFFELAGQPTWPKNNRLPGITHLPLIAHPR